MCEYKNWKPVWEKYLGVQAGRCLNPLVWVFQRKDAKLMAGMTAKLNKRESVWKMKRADAGLNWRQRQFWRNVTKPRSRKMRSSSSDINVCPTIWELILVTMLLSIVRVSPILPLSQILWQVWRSWSRYYGLEVMCKLKWENIRRKLSSWVTFQ